MRHYFVGVRSFAIGCLLPLSVLPARAALEIPIANHSFEQTAIPDGYYTVNTVPGWLGEGSWFHVANPVDSVFVGTSQGSTGGSGLDGANTAAVNNYGHLLYQQLTETVQPNMTYTLTVLAGHRIGVPVVGGSVNLIAGDWFLGRAFPNPPEGYFASVTVVYNAPSSGDMLYKPLRIELRSVGEIGQGWFDDVHLTIQPTASGVAPSLATAYIPIPPDDPRYTPGAWTGFTPFGAGPMWQPPIQAVPESSTWAPACVAVLALIGFLSLGCRRSTTAAAVHPVILA